jgi:hypothetical protein
VIILAHGGTAGAVAESVFLAVPVVVFMLLSRWSKRKAAALAAQADEDGLDGDRSDSDDEEGAT